MLRLSERAHRSADNVQALKLGPLWFQPGITGWNFAKQAPGAFRTISLIGFISFIQPYLLTEILQMPASEQDRFMCNGESFPSMRIIELCFSLIS